MQLNLKTPCKALNTSETSILLEQENTRLQQENNLLQQENARLLRENNDLKRECANQERLLKKTFYKSHSIKAKFHSSDSVGQVTFVIGGLVVVFLLIFYGMGFFDFSFPSTVDNDSPVIERYR